MSVKKGGDGAQHPILVPIKSYSIFNFMNKISTSNNWNFVPTHCYIFCQKVHYSAILYKESEHKYSVKSEIRRVHCKKSLGTFPSPAGIHLPNSPWAGKIKLFPPRGGMSLTFFTV